MDWCTLKNWNCWGDQTITLQDRIKVCGIVLLCYSTRKYERRRIGDARIWILCSFRVSTMRFISISISLTQKIVFLIQNFCFNEMNELYLLALWFRGSWGTNSPTSQLPQRKQNLEPILPNCFDTLCHQSSLRKSTVSLWTSNRCFTTYIRMECTPGD